MAKYVCTECGHIFDEEDVKFDREWIGDDNYSSNSSGWYETTCCPKCGAEGYEEAGECDICGENYAEDDMILCGGDWYCKKCAEEVVEEFLSKWGMTEGAQAGLDLYEARMQKRKSQ